MKEILISLMLWLSVNTPFNTNHELPKVTFLPQEELNHLFYGEHKIEGNKLYGMYSLETDTIILPNTWDPNKPWDLAVLLHEMIHYLQDMNEMEFNCVQEMERDAWPIQQFYLKKVHDYDWDYDAMWYMVISTCADPLSY